ncbi:MAG: RluA family pseudouridine synthase [Ruminococcaceae bacterium]|nr:RluA family pseudouridine synthase [Oscillospiraceae bacterium]
MKTITAGKNDAGQRLDKFLLKFLNSMPKSLLYKAFRKKRIKVNGKKADSTYVLMENDVLELYINDEFFSEEKKVCFCAAPKIDIIYEDENILIADKPKGVLMHGTKTDHKTLTSNLLAYLYNKGEYNPENEQSFSPAFANRIDRNTRGLVVAGKNATSLRELNERIRNREIKKFYICTLSKEPEQKNGEIETYLKKDKAENKVYVCDKGDIGAQYAKTRYNILKTDKDGVLCEVELITGRTHQIRAHMAYIGCPISGDVKYGARNDGKKTYQELISYKLLFDFKESKEGELSYLSGRSFTILQNKL